MTKVVLILLALSLAYVSSTYVTEEDLAMTVKEMVRAEVEDQLLNEWGFSDLKKKFQDVLNKIKGKAGDLKAKAEGLTAEAAAKANELKAKAADAAAAQGATLATVSHFGEQDDDSENAQVDSKMRPTMQRFLGQL